MWYKLGPERLTQLGNSNVLRLPVGRLISSDTPFKYGNARFTMVHLKVLPDKVLIRYKCLIFNFICSYSVDVSCAILTYKKQWRNSQK